MLINCNSCEKKFIVPDNAITEKGRLVQCSSCGNKWTQYPSQQQKSDPIQVVALKEKTPVKKKVELKKITKINKPIIKNRKKKLPKYSEEYLFKKHGISLDKANTNINNKSNEQVSFGFYNSLILLIVIIITLSKCLHFFQDFIISNLPFTEFYINYFFESIKNIFEISKSLVSNY